MGFIKRSTQDTKITKVSETDKEYEKFSDKKNESEKNKVRNNDDGESTDCCGGQCKR